MFFCCCFFRFTLTVDHWKKKSNLVLFQPISVTESVITGAQTFACCFIYRHTPDHLPLSSSAGPLQGLSAIPKSRGGALFIHFPYRDNPHSLCSTSAGLLSSSGPILV